METQDLEILGKISSSCHKMTEVVNNVEFEELSTTETPFGKLFRWIFVNCLR
jgi:hypothetical protein